MPLAGPGEAGKGLAGVRDCGIEVPGDHVRHGERVERAAFPGHVSGLSEEGEGAGQLGPAGRHVREVQLHEPEAQPPFGRRAARRRAVARALGDGHRLATEGQPPVVVLVTAPQGRQGAEDPRLGERVGGRARQAERSLVVGAGVLEVSEHGVDVRPPLAQRELLGRRQLRARGGLDALVIARERFPVREHRAGGLGRPVREAGRRRPRFGLPIVIGKAGRELGEAIGVEALERLARATVELAAPRREEGRLGDVLRQRVLERVRDLLAGRALGEELEPGELAEARIDRALAVPDRGQERRGELAPEDRGGLEHALVVLVEAIDARGQDAVHRVGHRERGPASLVADRPRQLLEEEGIALALVEDQLGEGIARRGRGQDRPDDREALVRRQPPQRDLGRERPIAPGRSIAGPIAADQEHGRLGQALGEEREALLRRAIDPVEILDLEDERDAAGSRGATSAAASRRCAP